MNSVDTPAAGTEPPTTTANRVGLYSSILTVVITVVTFGLAITAIPNAGRAAKKIAYSTLTWTRCRSSQGTTCGCPLRCSSS